MSSAASLKEYLKKYESGGGGDVKEKRKKKKKKEKDSKTKLSSSVGGVLIVDEDPMWQKPVKLDEDPDDGNNSSGEDKPVVEEDIEIRRLRRLQQIQLRKPYLSISEDGSGWVSVSNKEIRRVNVYSPNHELGVSDSKSLNLSSPRQLRRRNFDTPSPEHDGIHDDSPTPQTRRLTEEDLSPPRKGRHDSPDLYMSRGCSAQTDLSPPRRNRNGPSDDLSPARRVQRSPKQRSCHDSPDLDISCGPSREADLSPPRRNRTDLLDDLSPDRRVRRFPPPQRGPHDSPDLDMSQEFSRRVDLIPPRRKRKDSSDDLSPARRRRSSPGLPNESRGVEAETSPPRKSRKTADEVYPPRRKDKAHRQSMEPLLTPMASATEHSLSRESKTKPTSTDANKKGGLFSRGEIKEVIDRKKAADISRLAALDPVKSGKGAEPVYRREGKRLSKEELLELQKSDEKPKEKKLEWGKGLAQKRQAEAREKEIESEKEKPFARTRDDPELDKMLKERIRWGDPMAHLVKNKHSDILLEDFGDDENMKESGFIIPQVVPSHSWIKRGIDPPPNRYKIKPGRHWDGVDRSNGYEKELFKRENEKRATQTEAYLWSVSEM